MVQVLNPLPPKGPSFLQSLFGGLAEGVPKGIEKYESLKKGNQQNQAIRKTFGNEIASLPPELQKIAVAESLKVQGKESLFAKKRSTSSRSRRRRSIIR